MRVGKFVFSTIQYILSVALFTYIRSRATSRDNNTDDWRDVNTNRGWKLKVPASCSPKLATYWQYLNLHTYIVTNMQKS